MIQSWHVSVQQQLTRPAWSSTSATSATRRANLSMLADINQARPPLPGENANATLAARRPIQGFGTISAVLPEAFSNYHALQAKVEYRRGSSLNLLNSFTWSKAIDNVSQVLEEPSGSTGRRRTSTTSTTTAASSGLRRAAPQRHELRLAAARRARAPIRRHDCRRS